MRHPTLSRKTRDLPSSSLTSRSNGSKPHPPSETLPWSLTGDEKEKKSTQGVLKVPQDDVSINGDRQLGSINSTELGLTHLRKFYPVTRCHIASLTIK